MDDPFYLTASEVTLTYRPSRGERRLSFARRDGTAEDWRSRCRAKLSELIGFERPSPGPVREVRRANREGIVIQAQVMELPNGLSLPAYLLEPASAAKPDQCVMAIHGHGAAEPCVGSHDDYHHRFALELARAGHRVLCPELRGFGLLHRPSLHSEGMQLEYWKWGDAMSHSLASDSFQRGEPLIGSTVLDLLRWEEWLSSEKDVSVVDAAGISYGGDLALLYPIFSRMVRRIFASGTMGSFESIFARGNNAPAHCIPNVLRWMDRSDIAGLNAPRPLLIHYGELDTPSPSNRSASYNDSAATAFAELQAIYAGLGAPPDRVTMSVSPNAKHEMDNQLLLDFLED